MVEKCQHTNARSSEDGDTGTHIVYCLDCNQITHACFKPLYDEIEKNLEEVRVWGVYHSKGYQRPSESAAAQRKMEEILTNLRTAMLMARIDKNIFVERIAKIFEERGEASVAASIRDLKLEVAIHEPEKK